jgi:hypothetical protein
LLPDDKGRPFGRSTQFAAVRYQHYRMAVADPELPDDQNKLSDRLLIIELPACVACMAVRTSAISDGRRALKISVAEPMVGISAQLDRPLRMIVTRDFARK